MSPPTSTPGAENDNGYIHIYVVDEVNCQNIIIELNTANPKSVVPPQGLFIPYNRVAQQVLATLKVCSKP